MPESKSVWARINPAFVYAMLKIATSGLIISEIGYFIASLLSHLSHTELLSLAMLLVVTSTIYMIGRNDWLGFGKILRSRRIDALLAFALGIFFSASFGGIFFEKYDAFSATLSQSEAFALLISPLGIFLIATIRIAQLNFSTKNSEDARSFFLVDKELGSASDDLLGMRERAEVFAEQVLNRGAKESLVFGIDAPWGIGKSTFVNFCREYWTKKYTDKVIIYRFEPLRHDVDENFLPKFIDGIIKAIQKEEFVPEIKPLFSRYATLMDGAKSLLSKWLSFEWMASANSIDDVFEDLEYTLGHLEKKLVIVIDDLDRINFDVVKEILFAIKKSFVLPNISFILCYDTENFGALDPVETDREKIAEFLEKFVNVKMSLFLDSDKLSDYISKSLPVVLKGNAQSDPRLVSEVLEPLKEIYASDEFDSYLPFIGDVRKLKRLINILLMLQVEKTEFATYDFNKRDLLHLILIYINYPNIFRKIYNTEANGKRGFFSALYPHEKGYPTDGSPASSFSSSDFKNSTKYNKYLKALQPNQRFLLEKVFSVKKIFETVVIDSMEEIDKRTRACFNGGWTSGRNLEDYLKLIIKTSIPQKGQQYRFYLNCINTIISGNSIESVFTQEEFNIEHAETPYRQFWLAVLNSIDDFDEVSIGNIIRHLIATFPRYSYFTDEANNLGLRDDVVYFLVKILNRGGWRDQSNRHSHNVEPYINEIAEWIFGENRHEGNGVIETLGDKDRGILGLYDLHVFRLTCCADRGGDVFNLQRALGKHADPNTADEGSTAMLVKNEMREMSQKVFALFKRDYIETGKNIFELSDELTIEEMAGDYHPLLKKLIADGAIEEASEKIASFRNRAVSLVVYQLTNDIINHGIGCGYYDEEGTEDGHGIKRKMNEYLFANCFDVDAPSGSIYFVDYGLMNLVRGYATIPDEREYHPTMAELLKVFDKDQLLKYWSTNSEKIKQTIASNGERVVYAGYKAIYSVEGPKLVALLDEEVTKRNLAVGS